MSLVGLKLTPEVRNEKGRLRCPLTRISQSWNNNIALWKRKWLKLTPIHGSINMEIASWKRRKLRVKDRTRTPEELIKKTRARNSGAVGTSAQALSWRAKGFGPHIWSVERKLTRKSRI